MTIVTSQTKINCRLYNQLPHNNSDKGNQNLKGKSEEFNPGTKASQVNAHITKQPK